MLGGCVRLSEVRAIELMVLHSEWIKIVQTNQPCMEVICLLYLSWDITKFNFHKTNTTSEQDEFITINVISVNILMFNFFIFFDNSVKKYKLDFKSDITNNNTNL